MTLKIADNAPTIYAYLDTSTYQPAVCAAAGHLAQQLAAPLTLCHIIDTTGLQHKPKPGDNAADADEAGVLSKLLHLEDGLANGEVDDMQTELEDWQHQLNADYLIKVVTQQVTGDFLAVVNAQPNQGWRVMGKSGTLTQGDAHALGGYVLPVLQTPLPTLLVATPYHPMSEIMLLLTEQQADVDWLARLAAKPEFCAWLQDKSLHLVMVSSHPAADMTQNTLNPPAKLVTPEIGDLENTLEVIATSPTQNLSLEAKPSSIIDEAVDKLKQLVQKLSPSEPEMVAESTQASMTYSPARHTLSENSTAVMPATLISTLDDFYQATQYWNTIATSVKRQILYPADTTTPVVASHALNYAADNLVNGMILPSLSVPLSENSTLPVPQSAGFLDDALIALLIKKFPATVMMMS